LERVPSAKKSECACNILLAWRAVANGTTDKTQKAREKYWGHWTEYCRTFGIDPFLRRAERLEAIVIAAGFAAKVRTGAYGKRNQIKVQGVAQALAAISKTIELAGEQSPIYTAPDTYILPIQRLIEGFRREDPPPVPQLAVPVTVPMECHRIAIEGNDVKLLATSQLITIAFFYLLRVGEYTHPRYVKRQGQLVRATRTKQFAVEDVGFFKDGKVLPRRSPLDLLLTADSATMKISNQKNGRMGQTIHHESTDEKGAVAALAKRVNHILSNGGTEQQLICDYWTATGWAAVTSQDLIDFIRLAASSLKLDESGIDSDLLGVHSLRAGGAMALKLHGFSDTIIKKFGRWSSLTFLEYIHNQIAHLSFGVAAHMSVPLPFVNIAVVEPANP